MLLVLLSAAVFLVRTVALMLGPLLVELAATFHMSVAATGQLAAAINISWGIAAPLVGPISDTYGRRLVGLTGLMLMATGVLGSILAWNYEALLACRLLTGVSSREPKALPTRRSTSRKAVMTPSSLRRQA